MSKKKEINTTVLYIVTFHSHRAVNEQIPPIIKGIKQDIIKIYIILKVEQIDTIPIIASVILKTKTINKQKPPTTIAGKDGCILPSGILNKFNLILFYLIIFDK